MTKSNPPVVLCFSGADPTGGAGIQADIETLSSLGCLAASVITVITVQDTVDVHSFSPLPADLIIEQARAVLEDMPVAAIKIGVIGSPEVAMAIHSIITDYPHIPIVYDPVLSTERNSPLSTDDLTDTVRALILPLTKVLTPNIYEVHALSPGSDTPAAAAMGLLESDVEYILLTGTHGKTPDVVHTLYSNNRELESFHNERLPHKYHGSGCTLAASVAAQIALGQEVLGAVRKALDYTYKTLLYANRIGMGQYHPNRFFREDK